MSTLLLMAHERPDAVGAWRDGVPVRVRQMQRIAQVFTSGSTGMPEPPLKRWGSLVRNVQAAKGLGVTRAHAMVSTGPAQHMHDLESLAGFTGVERREGDAAIAQASCADAANLGRHCRAEPFNWFNCFDSWRRPAGGGPTPS